MRYLKSLVVCNMVVFLFYGCTAPPRFSTEGGVPHIVFTVKELPQPPLYLTVTSFYADFTLEYDRVWWSAIDTLDGWGYVIVQMDEKRGYISTDMKEGGGWRSKISMRFYKLNGVVRVIVRAYELKREVDSNGQVYWAPDTSANYYGDRLEEEILESMLQRLGL